MIQFTITEEVQKHIERHFSECGVAGSRFYSHSPFELLSEAAFVYPDLFKNAVLCDDGRYRISIRFQKEIGKCSVVALSSLTEDELETLQHEKRDGSDVMTVKLDREIGTDECQLIFTKDWYLVTMFPGPLAPPLPRNGEFSEYWNTHAFMVSLR